MTAAIRAYTSGVLLARRDNEERTKCACGQFKPVGAPGQAPRTRCDDCATTRKSRADADRNRRREEG